MAFPKGVSGNPKGKAPGTISKLDYECKWHISKLVDKMAPRLEEWLEQIYEQKGPEAAWDKFIQIIEYRLPKLARAEIKQEINGSDGEPIKIEMVLHRPKLDGE